MEKVKNLVNQYLVFDIKQQQKKKKIHARKIVKILHRFWTFQGFSLKIKLITELASLAKILKMRLFERLSSTVL